MSASNLDTANYLVRTRGRVIADVCVCVYLFVDLKNELFELYL